MAGTLTVDTVKSSTANPPKFQNTSGVETGQLCRAWVNFNGVTTATIRASFNVSSVTRNGTGDYTVNFTNAMPDGNFSLVAGCYKDTVSGGNGPEYAARSNAAPAGTTTSIRINTGTTGSSSFSDSAYVDVAVFR